MGELLSDSEVTAACGQLDPGWSREGNSIVRSVRASSFASGIRLVDEVAAVSDALDHHPDIDVRWTTVTLRVTTHSAEGLTVKDFALAAEIDRLAAALGAA